MCACACVRVRVCVWCACVCVLYGRMSGCVCVWVMVGVGVSRRVGQHVLGRIVLGGHAAHLLKGGRRHATSIKGGRGLGSVEARARACELEGGRGLGWAWGRVGTRRALCTRRPSVEKRARASELKGGPWLGVGRPCGCGVEGGRGIEDENGIEVGSGGGHGPRRTRTWKEGRSRVPNSRTREEKLLLYGSFFMPQTRRRDTH